MAGAASCALLLCGLLLTACAELEQRKQNPLQSLLSFLKDKLRIGRPKPAVASAVLVPIIDISKLLNGKEDERREVAKKIGKACEDIGFFIITNHGIRDEVITSAWSATKEYFDLPEEEKLKLVLPQHEYPFGYSRFGDEVLSAGKAAEKSSSTANSTAAVAAPDLKELFSLGPSHPLSGFPGRILPEVPTSFEGSWTAYYNDMEELAAKILGAFALVLNLEESFFEQFIDHHASALRALNYPHIEGFVPRPGQLRASAHTDYGTITILRSDAPGLQVSKDKDPPNWIDVPFVKDGLIINLGDLMKRWTNDKWLSTLHRVVNPTPDDTCWAENSGSTRRQSMAFFHNPNRDAVIKVLGDPARAKYDPIVAGDFLMQKHLAATGKA
jgi:isopenicillin N synthase-like dioxygenase